MSNGRMTPTISEEPKSGLTFNVFVLAAAASAMNGRSLPRWLRWAGVVIGAAGLITPIIGILDPNDYNPVPAWRAVDAGGQRAARHPRCSGSPNRRGRGCHFSRHRSRGP
jgi:hypothetical protein